MPVFDINSLKARHFPAQEKAPARYAEEVVRRVQPGMVVVDAGCGRSAPVLRLLPASVRRIGVDLVEPTLPPESGIEFHRRDLADTGLPSNSCDMVISRSVLEHLDEPERVFNEIARILKPGGSMIFLTPNGWDYVSIIARLVPNRFHPLIVSQVEGRAEDDVFPVVYRANSARALRRISTRCGLDLVSLDYLGSQPSYLKFSSALYAVGTAYDLILRRYKVLHPLRGWILGVLTKPAHSAGDRQKPGGSQ